jgi:hypothetical protein
MSTTPIRRAAAASLLGVLGPTLHALPASAAPATDPTTTTATAPVPVDIEQSQLDQAPTTTTPVATSDRSISQCGTYRSSYKYSTKVLWWTVDVFRHANTTGACENDAVITHIYEVDNTCTKYAWGVTYMLKAGYRFGPDATPGTKSAFGTATCAVSIGGEIGGVGVKYTKQSNTRHTFEMQGTGAVVHPEHWTTTP